MIIIITIIIIIQLAQVFAGEDPSSTMAVMFDVFGSLLVITNNKYVFTAHSPIVQCLLWPWTPFEKDLIWTSCARSETELSRL